MIIAEFPFGESIGDRFQDGLACWLAASQCMEANLVRCQVNVSADQAMGPRAVHDKGVSEQTDMAMGICSAQEYHAAFWESLEIKLPGGGKRSSRWSRFNTQPSTLSVGG